MLKCYSKCYATETHGALKTAESEDQLPGSIHPRRRRSFTKVRVTGEFVDLMADAEMKSLVEEIGFNAPITISAWAFEELVLGGTTLTREGELVFPGAQSLKSRLMEILASLREAIDNPQGEYHADRVYFQAQVDTMGNGILRTFLLVCLVEPGDDGKKVLTIFMEGKA
jgi:hypothetical protein